jgi:Rps23 Pro-64 3,4-dihydroxylase Tpa1-like proline 4-hydroxylase
MNETEALIKELNYNVDWLVSKYKESTLSENFWRTGAYSVFEDDTELINLKTSNKKLQGEFAVINQLHHTSLETNKKLQEELKEIKLKFTEIEELRREELEDFNFIKQIKTIQTYKLRKKIEILELQLETYKEKSGITVTQFGREIKKRKLNP